MTSHETVPAFLIYAYLAYGVAFALVAFAALPKRGIRGALSDAGAALILGAIWPVFGLAALYHHSRACL